MFVLSEVFHHLEKENVYLYNNKLSNKILICIFPIIPTLSISLNEYLFNSSNFNEWPSVNTELLVEDEINLPIQIQGKLVTTIPTKKGYDEKIILGDIYKLDKIKNKINDKKIVKVINVQDKIINIIIS